MKIIRTLAILALSAIAGCSLLPTKSPNASDNAGAPRRFGISGSIQPVNTGTAPNAGNGDTLYTAFTKLNSNDAIFQNMFPSTLGLLKGTGAVPNPLAPASFADVTALWSCTTPTSGYALAMDGTCQPISGGGSGGISSITITPPSGLTVTPGTLTSNGTFLFGGVLALSAGGTNATTANGALNNLLPSQVGNAGYCLTTNGTNTGWSACGSGGGGNVSTSGTITVGSLPYWVSATAIGTGNLSGDVTTAGTLATTVNSIGGNAVSLGGTLTTTGGNLTVTVAGATNAVMPATGTVTLGYLNCPVNSQSTAYTTTLADQGKCLYNIAPAPATTFIQGKAVTQVAGLTSQSATLTSAQTAGDTLIVGIGNCSTTSTISSVTDTAGDTFAVAAPLTTQAGYGSAAIYYAANIASNASNTITVNYSASTGCSDLKVGEWSGILTTSPVDVTASASATTGTTLSSGSATTTVAADLIVGNINANSTGPTVGSGFTSRVASIGGGLLEDESVTATGSYAATATQTTSTYWIAQMVAFKAANQLNTFTINSALAYPAGTVFSILNCPTCGTLTLGITGGGTLYLGGSPSTPGSRTVNAGSQGTLWRDPSNNWLFFGGAGTH